MSYHTSREVAPWEGSYKLLPCTFSVCSLFPSASVSLHLSFCCCQLGFLRGGRCLAKRITKSSNQHTESLPTSNMGPCENLVPPCPHKSDNVSSGIKGPSPRSFQIFNNPQAASTASTSTHGIELHVCEKWSVSGLHETYPTISAPGSNSPVQKSPTSLISTQRKNLCQGKNLCHRKGLSRTHVSDISSSGLKCPTLKDTKLSHLEIQRQSAARMG